jgi:ribosomal protein L7Ae-like RNA K-turn-binding protein
MQAKKAYIILLTSDISPKTAKEAVFFSTKYGVKLQRTSLTSARIKELLGKTAVVMAVNDEGFGKKFEELLNLVHSDTKENEVEYDKENKTD